MRLPGEPASVPVARRFVAERITALDAEIRETAVLLVSEVVTNAVLHARTDVTVRCSVGPGGVLVEVDDENPLAPRPRMHDADALTGRGLEMVELLATTFGVVPGTDRKRVWFTVGTVAGTRRAGWSTAATSETVAVRLLSVPVRLYDVLQQHNEAVLREYELVLLGEAAGAKLRRDAGDAGRARALIVESIREAEEATPGARRVDVSLNVPVQEARAFDLLPTVLDEAEAAARRGDLLARPALPELLELRSWLYGEITRQLDGQQPVAWDSVSSYVEPADVPEVDVDLSWVARAPEPVVVADEANRIIAVSAAAADLLGWDADDLVGRRVTVIVPSRQREEHVTGFTRQVLTGQGRLIGRQVRVPALRRDGSEVGVTLSLRREEVSGHTVYVAGLVPVETSG